MELLQHCTDKKTSAPHNLETRQQRLHFVRLRMCALTFSHKIVRRVNVGQRRRRHFPALLLTPPSISATNNAAALHYLYYMYVHSRRPVTAK